MENGKRSLDFENAVQAWIERHRGTPVHVICSMFGVDPRRLYEVWMELKFPGSRPAAEKIINNVLPSNMPSVALQPHVEKLRIARRIADDDSGQIGMAF